MSPQEEDSKAAQSDRGPRKARAPMADDDGKVIYQSGTPEISLHQLALVLETASVLRAKTEDKSQGKTALAELTGASRRFEVEVGGRKFKLFVQPAALPFREEGA